MIKDLKARLLPNWSLWRITRFILSVVFIIHGIIKLDYLVLSSGIFLFFHALLNACLTCVDENCEIPQK